MSILLRTLVPGPRSRELMKRREQCVARGPFHSTPIFVENASGAHIEDVDGNRFLDFASGIGVTNVGHCPARVVDAIAAQARSFIHTGFHVAPYESYLALARELNARTPGSFAKKTLLLNSGAEAVENAIKIARAYTGRPGVLCFEHGFHGRTYMALALTAKENPYKQGFGPYSPDVHRAPYPYAYRSHESKMRESHLVEDALAALEAMMHHAGGPQKFAALIIEPITGEGGFIPAPQAYLQALRELCDRHKIVLIADEIQSGFGRSGTLFACSQLGLVPDLMTVAKGLAAGMPLSAVVGRSEIMDAAPIGGLGGTYGGNPVACAAALEVLKLFDDEKLDLLTRARSIAELVETRFREWQRKYEIIGDVRGLGAMQALELVKDRRTKEPAKEATVKLLRYAYEHGVISIAAGTYGNVVRLLVPLIIEASDLTEGLDVLEAGLKQL